MAREGVLTLPVQRIAVMGAGSWGTTFAKVLADAGRDVVLWARRAEVADAVACHAILLALIDLSLPATGSEVQRGRMGTCRWTCSSQ